jgi:hypothetical protein
MNDLQALRELGTTLDTDHSGPVAEIRARVMAGLSVAGSRRSIRRQAVPRLGWRVALAGGLAAAMAAGAFTLHLGDIDRNAPPRGAAGPPRSAAGPPRGAAGPADLLRLAARTAATAPELTPRPDQFILIESTVSDMMAAQPVGPGPVAPPGPGPTRMPWHPVTTRHWQEWRSADGTHDGLIRGSHGDSTRLPGCVNGLETTVPGDDHGPAPCRVAPGYLKDLPTDADAMLAYLGRMAADYHLEARSAAVLLLFQGYLPPPARAALFEALAKIPGAVLIDDLTDAAGRHGMAVARTTDGVRGALIFDPASYAFLGARTDAVADNVSGLPVGATLWSHAIDRIAVVDQAGQLPG